jgi:hypothetical protein
MRLTVIEMLRTIADLRAAGDKPGAIGREQYVYTDPLNSEIEVPTADLPQAPAWCSPLKNVMAAISANGFTRPLRRSACSPSSCRPK